MILRVCIGASVIILVMVVLLLNVPGVSAHYTGAKIMCYSSSSVVVVDGKWTTPQEWEDAAEVSGVSGVYFRVKHDESFIYFLFDHILDSQLDPGTSPERRDQCGVRLDLNHDGGSKPLSDDRSFAIQYNPVRSKGVTVDLFVAFGTDTGWSRGTLTSSGSVFWGDASTDASNNSRSKSPHAMYEMKIPKSVLANVTVSDLQKAGTIIGIQMTTFDGGDVITRAWPKASAANVPDSWGDMEFSTSKAPGPNKNPGTLTLLGSLIPETSKWKHDARLRSVTCIADTAE